MNTPQKNILITGAAKRIGKSLALAAAELNYHIFLHYSSSGQAAQETKQEIENLGSSCTLIQADFSNPDEAINIFRELFAKEQIAAIVNNASIFSENSLLTATSADWEINHAVNLQMPFLLTQAYANSPKNKSGKVINMLDWRALRPGHDHFAYTMSKAGLVSLTKAAALALAPNFQVTGLALGAILPPSDGGDTSNIIKQVPMGRWAQLDEVVEAFLFLLNAPAYITGEIIHVDGGRHLV